MGKPYARFDEGALGNPLSAVVRSRRVHRNVREQLQVNTSALLYPNTKNKIVSYPPDGLTKPAVVVPFQGVGRFLLSIRKTYRITGNFKLSRL